MSREHILKGINEASKNNLPKENRFFFSSVLYSLRLVVKYRRFVSEFPLNGSVTVSRDFARLICRKAAIYLMTLLPKVHNIREC